ncbi:MULTISPECIES: DUF488 domain-containing protein [Arthrospira]|uniref:DUF488 domain-containing protein n=1 Tax=Limnospira platensis NIES-46 TaxID=1236695 RepID=A0A5M3T6D2_LIMPL|nr:MULTISPECIES: DUF488 domain-containing protein [Arthrospira]AMW29035.1 hypothetical protein AP285_14790 [Arthrospira platensis YZ]KDR55006.1 hypothetical protein APPUASWS_024590 [Arthrospira platensis str. Paraca]MBD2708654.1 DUF488 domain-containing protein [Arthrospira platensis FACHB-835]MDF2212856.1 DUF488 domain-containing protein [Arthrospira platensis NCB002]MDT9182843.1 DUF488 domain-containing protein [Limnospira sp. PMC 289.06]MDT9293948.1 DUF488 domain-containing protein [Arthro
MELFSIGHSNHEIDAFISLLQKHRVTAVADVRSHPYSRFLSHFNRSSLQEFLAQQGIQYVFLGRELGARPSNPDCYINGKAVYERIALTDAFHQGIKRLHKGLKKHKISLMCAEQDPLTCHRAILVCQHLRDFDIPINHILKNGDLESHEHLEDRMLVKHGFRDFGDAQEVQLSLFSPKSLPTREECLSQAYQLQGDEIAYVEKENKTHEN